MEAKSYVQSQLQGEELEHEQWVMQYWNWTRVVWKNVAKLSWVVSHLRWSGTAYWALKVEIHYCGMCILEKIRVGGLLTLTIGILNCFMWSSLYLVSALFAVLHPYILLHVYYSFVIFSSSWAHDWAEVYQHRAAEVCPHRQLKNYYNMDYWLR